MLGERGGRGAGHITVGALVRVDVGPHMITEESLKRELLATIRANEILLTSGQLPFAMIVEF